MFNIVFYILQLFSFNFIINCIIWYTVLYFLLSKNIFKKSCILYFFFFIIIFLFHYYDIMNMFGFFVFIETTVIFMYILVCISFFNIFINKIKRINYFFTIFIIFFFDNSYVDFFNYYFNYLDTDLEFYNDFLGLYIFLYCFNYILFFLLILLFFTIFNFIFISTFFNTYRSIKKKTVFFKRNNIFKFHNFVNPIFYFK